MPPGPGRSSKSSSSGAHKVSSSTSSKPPKPGGGSSTKELSNRDSSTRDASSKRKGETWTENELLEHMNTNSTKPSKSSRDTRAIDDKEKSRNEGSRQHRKRDETTEERAERKRREKQEGIDNSRRSDTKTRTDDRHDAGKEERKESRKKDETPEERHERKKREREKEKENLHGESGEGDLNRHKSESSTSKRRHDETPEERAERKKRERGEREVKKVAEEESEIHHKRRETSEERAERKKREHESRSHEETPEERHERKKRERAERKAKEAGELAQKQKAEEELRQQKYAYEDEKAERRRRRKHDETPEERLERKAREKAEKENREKDKIAQNSETLDLNSKAVENSGSKQGEITQARENEDYYNDDYADDFEDYNYDDDFEQDQSRESFGNEGSKQGSKDTSRVIEDVANNGDFTVQALRQNQKPEPPKEKDYTSTFSVTTCAPKLSEGKRFAMAEKLKLRSFALLNRIELDYFSKSLFELNPLSEYEMFMRKFGYSDTTQVACQTREENVEIETQTEPSEKMDAWTQNPSAGGQVASKTIDPDSSADDEKDLLSSSGRNDSRDFRETDFSQVTDTRKLNQFLMKSSKLMSSLLGSRDTIGQAGKAKSYFEIADTFSSLIIAQNEPLLVNKEVVAISNNDFKLIVCLRSSKSEISENGLICVYSNVSLKKPTNYLVCFSELSTCLITKNPNVQVVFGGAVDGVIYMWDLNRGDPIKKVIDLEPNCQVEVTYETFSTALSYRSCSVDAMHKSAVRQLILAESEELHNTTRRQFQLCSADETGFVMFWTYHSSEGDQELTLMPGNLSKFSLCHYFDLQSFCEKYSHVVGIEPGLLNKMMFHPNMPSKAFFATSLSAIVNTDCFNEALKPKLYRAKTGSQITQIEFCPVNTVELFVTCSDDGTISLFTTSKPDPIVSYTAEAMDATCIHCLWDVNFPMVIFVLTQTSVLVLDVTKLSHGSFLHCKLRDYASKPVGMGIWKDSVTKRFVLAVAYESGDIEFHDLLGNFMKIQSSIEQKKVLEFFANRELIPKL
ncbi:uncharacterized protein LOC142340629 [Convolutriloba macropyga]|uniref:uncharacterized protein LOC142340629 n=1 Tax=Convolutriloba macropyga TaxID=536237 RepID=UPI003F526849